MNVKNLLISTASLLLISSVVQANVSVMAVKSASNDHKTYIRVTLNNQASSEITTDSNLVPAEAKVIQAHNSALFSVEIPDNAGIQSIRYFNGSSGCDFYIDTQNGPFGNDTFITGIPIDSFSMCNVQTIGSINHLAVSFFRP